MPETSSVEHYISVLKHENGKHRIMAILENEDTTVMQLLDTARLAIDVNIIRNIFNLGILQWK